MKAFRFRPFSGNAQSVVNYLKVDLAKGLSDLVESLRHLTLERNFDSFTFEVNLATGETVKIPNRLKALNLKWWVVRATGDNRLVEDGTMSRDFIFIKNASSATTRATIVFVR